MSKTNKLVMVLAGMIGIPCWLDGSDVTIEATSVEDVECSNCPESRKGRRICYDVMLSADAANSGAKDFHVEVSDNQSLNFRCPSIAKKTDDEEFETLDSWEFGHQRVSNDIEQRTFIDWWTESGEEENTLIKGQTFRFCFVYCSIGKAALDNTIEFVLTDGGGRVLGVPDFNGNRSNVPDDEDGNDDPDWEGTATDTDKDAKVGFEIAFAFDVPFLSTTPLMILTLIILISYLLIRSRSLRILSGRR